MEKIPMRLAVLFIPAAILAITLISPTLPASAAEIGIKISPIKIDELVQPGETISRNVKVTNNSPDSKTFYPYLNDFTAGGETGQAVLVPAGSEVDGLANWISISSEGVEFGPGETKDIPFTINVPTDATPGGHYGAVLVGTEAPKLKIEGEDKGAGMATAQKTACLVLLQVAGDVIEEAAVREFSTDKNFYNTPFDVALNVRIENTGNTHVKPQGSIQVRNMLGKEVNSIKFNEIGSNVLRKSIRKFDNHWEGGLAFGRYKAELGLSYGTDASKGGQGRQTLYSEKTFWIFPWKIIVPILIVLAAGFGLTIFLLKLYRDRAVKRAMEQIGARKVPYTKKYKGKSDDMILRVSIMVITVSIVLLVVYFMFFA